MARYLTLQNLSDTSIVNGDLIGQIGFAASNDSDGGDAIAICSSISVKAEGTFDGSNNPGAIVFATAPNNGPTDRLKVTNEGHFVPIADTSYDLGVSGSLHFRDVCLSGIVFDDGTYQTTAAAGGGTPAGSDTEVQFNDGGAFGADANFTYDKTNTKLSVIGPYSTGFLATGVTEDAEENLIQFKSTNDADSIRYLFRYTRDGKLYLGQNGSYDIRTYLGGDGSSQNELRMGRDGLGSFIGFSPFGKYINIDGGGGEYLQFDTTTRLYNDTSHTFGMRSSSNPYGLRIYASGDTTNYARLSIQANTSDYNYEISPQVNNGVAGSVVVTNDTSSQEILVVKGAASQSANLTEWQNSSSVVQAYIDETGGFSGTSVTINDYALPLADGSANQVLTTDGAGNVTFEDAAGGGGDATPSGNSTEFQYNNGGVFGGTTGVVYEATNGTGILLKVHGTGSPKDNLFSVEYTGVNAETTVSIYRNNSTDTSNLFQVRTEASGDLFTVSPTGKVYERSSHGNVEHSGSASSFTFDLDESNIFTATLSSTSSTVSIANGDVGQRFILRLTNGVANAKVGTWFSNINWPGGNPASGSLVAGETNLFGFLTYSGNGGTLYHDGFAIATGVT